MKINGEITYNLMKDSESDWICAQGKVDDSQIDFMFEFLFSLRSTLMAMVPRGGIQIANTKSIGLTESDRLHFINFWINKMPHSRIQIANTKSVGLTELKG